MSRKALVLGAGGFIGSHMVSSLKDEGYYVRGVDIKKPDFSESDADEFIIFDLRNQEGFQDLLLVNGEQFNEIYQFAADMGGAGFIFTGENDAEIMTNSIQVNVNLLDFQKKISEQKKNYVTEIFYSSSACIYPEFNQTDPNNPNCEESTAYPAQPDSEYGWEKLFSERLFLSYKKNFNLKVHIARYHNIFGPMGTFEGGREKAPAALCRKVAECSDNGEIEVWGPGNQTRSFLYIDECIEATKKLTRSDHSGPVNIGSEEMISINDLASMIIDVSEKNIKIKNIPGPLGVNGRNSHNKLINDLLDWQYQMTLKQGIEKTYSWINEQLKNK